MCSLESDTQNIWHRGMHECMQQYVQANASVFLLGSMHTLAKVICGTSMFIYNIFTHAGGDRLITTMVSIYSQVRVINLLLFEVD